MMAEHQVHGGEISGMLEMRCTLLLLFQHHYQVNIAKGSQVAQRLRDQHCATVSCGIERVRGDKQDTELRVGGSVSLVVVVIDVWPVQGKGQRICEPCGLRGAVTCREQFRKLP